jgi:signal transduction histidine kinase
MEHDPLNQRIDAVKRHVNDLRHRVDAEPALLAETLDELSTCLEELRCRDQQCAAARADLDQQIRERTSQLLDARQTLRAEIAARLLAEQALAERGRLAALGADVATALTEGGTLQTMLQECAKAIVRQLDAAFARIWTVDRHGLLLELQASAGMYTHVDGTHSRIPIGQFKIGLIAQQRQPHLTNAVIGDPQVHDQEWAQREKMVAFAGYPLILDERLVGVMAMFARKPLERDTLTALAGVARAITLGIERKRGEEALLQLQDEERRRIGRQLHDSTAQNLAALAMNLALISKASDALDPKSRKALSESSALAERCSQEIRTISYLLHPPLLDEMGLASAVRCYADGFARRSGLQVDVKLPPHLGRLPQEIEMTLFLILQESLTNVHRHADSRTASVEILRYPAAVTLRVGDAGRGMAPKIADACVGSDAPLGVGIMSMRERMRQLGGQLDIRSSHRGTTVTAILPLRTGCEFAAR